MSSNHVNTINSYELPEFYQPNQTWLISRWFERKELHKKNVCCATRILIQTPKECELNSWLKGKNQMFKVNIINHKMQ